MFTQQVQQGHARVRWQIRLRAVDGNCHDCSPFLLDFNATKCSVVFAAWGNSNAPENFDQGFRRCAALGFDC
jgi:hypothetical protein